ncbi:hypothetical protein SAMN05444156_2375 [Verrucomicrobium sp. GAS474]|uniref:hypothetical protein n=1 Tax=Verrucomicrobium sp. GAS474 TaxID=1882831 RepID=UPI00087D630B|nr:hypothetical protein [Verrucomicrobium sp. GAS474]SDU16858.1 hypothetical protein SAMN05444156_2375 [Verrucomicrobium sp. GAS474]
MSVSSRILVASNDANLNFALDGLLGAFRASIFYADTEEKLVTFLSAADGFDMVVFDAACAEISMETVYRTMQKHPGLAQTFLLMLLPEVTPGTAIFAYNLKADAVLARQLDIPAFMTVCREAIRSAGTIRRVAEVEKRLDALEEKAEDEEKQALEEEETARKASVALSGPKENKPLILSDENRPPLIQHLEKAVLAFFSEMKVAGKDIYSKKAEGVLLRGDFIGWTGVFLPASSEWYDVVLNFTRPGAEYISGELYGRGTDDTALQLAIVDFVGRVQTLYRENSETGRGPSSAVFTQPLTSPRFPWIGEMGTPSYSHLFRLPKLMMVCDFYQTRGTPKIKPAGGISPGDVMNENISAPGQSRIALVNRGVVLTEERLRKIVPMVEATRNFWVIEPSLMTRQLHAGPGK